MRRRHYVSRDEPRGESGSMPILALALGVGAAAVLYATASAAKKSPPPMAPPMVPPPMMPPMQPAPPEAALPGPLETGNPNATVMTMARGNRFTAQFEKNGAIETWVALGPLAPMGRASGYPAGNVLTKETRMIPLSAVQQVL